MQKKFGAITVILIVLLAVRMIAQVVYAARAANPSMLIVFSGLAVIYLVALLGVVLKQLWGAVMVIVMSGLDLLVAFLAGGIAGMGAGVADLLMLYLGYKEYKQVAQPEQSATANQSRRKPKPQHF